MSSLRMLLCLFVGMGMAPLGASSPLLTNQVQDERVSAPPIDRARVRSDDLFESLTRWTDRYRSSRSWWLEAEAQLEVLVRESLAVAETSPQGLVEVTRRLLDIASLGLQSVPNFASAGGKFAEAEPPEEWGDVFGTPVLGDHLGFDRGELGATRAVASNAIEVLLGSETRERVARYLGEVIVGAGQYPISQRYLAVSLCFAHRLVAGKRGMMAVAWDQKDELRPAVLGLLAEWPDDATDLFLVRLLGREFDRKSRPHPFTILLRRIRGTDQPLGVRAATELALRLQAMLHAKDWRTCSRAIELSQGLDPKGRAPLLIAALSAWTKRDKAGNGSRRLIGDLVRRLTQISGRSIGRNPRAWETWWNAVEAGTTPLHAEVSPDSQRSSAGFFGLRAVSDRLTFILDISGSMETPWRTEGHSRYVEAIDQMMGYLQSVGEEGAFNVILFSSDVIRSSKELVPCTATNLERARTSLLERRPIGGTNLRPAIELALGLDKRGGFDHRRLAADTFVVLCDGATTSGRSWVKPLLRRVQPEAQVRIHCVLIGTQGDGTLEALAEGTGGDLVRID